MSKPEVRIAMLEREDSVLSADDDLNSECCGNPDDAETEIDNKEPKNTTKEDGTTEYGGEIGAAGDTIDGRAKVKRARGCAENNNNWAENKNVAEGLMDIALLSANANQLRFLITYNNKASTYFISLGLVALSLAFQVAVGIALIFKRRIKRGRIKRTQTRINEFLIGGVFMVTVVNVLLAAFTTTDGGHNNNDTT